MNWIASLFSADTRKWIYDVCMAVIPLLVILGVLNNEVAGQVMLIAAAVLGTGSNLLARANVTPEATTQEYKG
jgi:uncharacterized membrane protein YjjB (DUF3815 family)